ncbi:MAG TPA: YHYH domain-containing protein [Limnohabitans sp.]|nr:YHYH domain-containing protein [Limnohabitans sp.]HQR85613.1 YHYH domain-containing protein [Limnohabitans sp.]
MLFLLAVRFAFAHGGGLNSEGCHTNHKTGDYHCHRAPAVVQPATPQRQQQDTTPRQPPTCYTGPRGGTYTITPSGKKNYNGC